MFLVPTVIKSINDHELGGIIRFAQKNMDVVHAVNFQPVSLTGRMIKKNEKSIELQYLIALNELKNNFLTVKYQKIAISGFIMYAFNKCDRGI